MIAPALLISYAVLIGTIGARRLADAKWPYRSPRLGIWIWQALTASIVLAALMAVITLALPALPVTTSLATWLDACQQAIEEQYSTLGGAAGSSLGIILVLAILGRLGFVLTATHISVAWRRGQQRRALMLVSQPHAVTRTLVLPHATPAVYCLPGLRGIIVLTSAATAILDDHQLCAVLDHERAHLRHRHDLILTAAAALRAAFPFVPAFTAAQTQLQRLVEMHADDVATRCHDRKTLATALVALVEGGIPSTAIGAGGSGAVARVQRLIRPADPLQLRWLALGCGAATSLLTLPLIIALAPAVVSALLNYCPIGFPPAAR